MAGLREKKAAIRCRRCGRTIWTRGIPAVIIWPPGGPVCVTCSKKMRQWETLADN